MATSVAHERRIWQFDPAYSTVEFTVRNLWYNVKGRFNVLEGAIVLGVVGVAAGLAASFGLTRLISTLLFEVTATDAATFTAVSVGLFLVTLIACYVPARRATRVDPLKALRYE